MSERMSTGAGSGYRVLLVEDDKPTRSSLARLLELYGFEVTAVADGTQALEVMKNEPVPQIVLTDLMLPGEDGHEVARCARALRPRPIVAVATGATMSDGADRMRALCVDRVFLKPFAISAVVDALMKLVEARREP